MNNRCIYMEDGGGGTDDGGLTPTEVISLVVEDEMLAKAAVSNFSNTVKLRLVKKLYESENQIIYTQT